MLIIILIQFVWGQTFLSGLIKGFIFYGIFLIPKYRVEKLQKEKMSLELQQSLLND